MDEFDLRLSRKMKKLLQRIDRLAEAEMGERVGIGLVLFPFTRDGEESRQAECQYISNAPRGYMHGALKTLVDKWDTGLPDIPPHEKQ